MHKGRANHWARDFFIASMSMEKMMQPRSEIMAAFRELCEVSGYFTLQYMNNRGDADLSWELLCGFAA